MSTSFADTIFEVAKATTEAARTAYEAGFAAGHHQGYLDGLEKARQLVNATIDRPQVAL